MINPRRRHQPDRFVMAGSQIGDSIRTRTGEKIGQLEDIVFDADTGEALYAVLSFIGLLSLGDRLIIVPWQRLQMDTDNRCLIIEMEKELLALAPGFHRGERPDMADPAWKKEIVGFYRNSSTESNSSIKSNRVPA